MKLDEIYSFMFIKVVDGRSGQPPTQSFSIWWSGNETQLLISLHVAQHQYSYSIDTDNLGWRNTEIMFLQGISFHFILIQIKH